jgi:hypothetical protein
MNQHKKTMQMSNVKEQHKRTMQKNNTKQRNNAKERCKGIMQEGKILITIMKH